MLKNYFLIAIRSFKKDSTNTFISLSGLLIGLTCVFLIIGYLKYETSFDKSYDNAPRIFQIVDHIQDQTDSYTTVNVPVALASTLQRDIPEIVAQTSLNYGQVSFVTNSGELQKVDRVNVDNSFFSMFDFEFIQGNANTAFSKPHSLVLTEAAAKNLFGRHPVVGSLVYTPDSICFTLTGIIHDLPANTFFKADAFINHPVAKETLDYMAFTGGTALIMIGENNSIQQVENKMAALYKKYNFDDAKVGFLPVKNIHLRAAEVQDYPPNYNIGNITYVYAYACIALLILIIGCSNFINLSIARSLERSKEIGVRKLFGAVRKQLIFQFLGESFLFFFVAFPLAMLLALICWRPFNYLLNINAGFASLINYQTVFLFIGISLIASILCSIYPAFILSKLNPAKAIKGGTNGFKLNMGLRKILIVLQFGISIVLIIGTLVIHEQLRFLNDQKLGFNKSNLIQLNFHDYGQSERKFKNELLHNPNVLSVTVSTLNIARSYGSLLTTTSPQDSTRGIRVATVFGDVDFIKTMSVPVIDGKAYAEKFLSTSSTTDSSTTDTPPPSYVSKSLLDVYGVKGDPIGRHIKELGCYVVGVIGDFKGISLKEENPYVRISIASKPLRFGYLYIRISGSNTSATLNFIEKKWKQLYPKNAFDYSFVDDRIMHLYDSETRLTKLFNIFSFLAILISCAGLFSLVSLMVRKRTKEIGVRKIMGASVRDIVLLISKGFLWLVLWAALVATPIAYYALHKWLQGYATKNPIHWGLLVVSGAVAIVIAFLSISFKSIAAAKANPVDSLRNE